MSVNPSSLGHRLKKDAHNKEINIPDLMPVAWQTVAPVRCYFLLVTPRFMQNYEVRQRVSLSGCQKIINSHSDITDSCLNRLFLMGTSGEVDPAEPERRSLKGLESGSGGGRGTVRLKSDK